jgi:hypothetical protein
VSPVRGKALEYIAAHNRIVRRLGPWWWPWWPLQESNKALRRRVLARYEKPGTTGDTTAAREKKP